MSQSTPRSGLSLRTSLVTGSVLAVVASILIMPKDDIDLSSYEILIRTKRMTVLDLSAELTSFQRPAPDRRELSGTRAPIGDAATKMPSLIEGMAIASVDPEADIGVAVIAPIPPVRENAVSTVVPPRRPRNYTGADIATRKINAFFKMANAFEPRPRPDLARQ